MFYVCYYTCAHYCYGLCITYATTHVLTIAMGYVLRILLHMCSLSIAIGYVLRMLLHMCSLSIAMGYVLRMLLHMCSLLLWAMFYVCYYTCSHTIHIIYLLFTVSVAIAFGRCAESMSTFVDDVFAGTLVSSVICHQCHTVCHLVTLSSYHTVVFSCCHCVMLYVTLLHVVCHFVIPYNITDHWHRFKNFRWLSVFITMKIFSSTSY